MNSPAPQQLRTDCVIPFLFEHLDIRGAWVSLDETWAGLTIDRNYPPAVMRLLGEMSAVSSLIAANLKQPGRMTFQLKGEGAIDLLVLDCDEQLRLRGMARSKPDIDESLADLTSLVGHGSLLLSLDAAGMQQPYQSLVSLEGDSIAEVFEHYLTRSEQQPTRLVLAASTSRATGLFLQKMPDADTKDADGWNRVQHLLQTLKAEELLSLDVNALLQSVFPEEDMRVYDARHICHHCPKDWEKIHTMLKALGREECDALLREHGEIHVRDDICNHDYRLGPEALAAVFEPPSSYSSSLH